MKPVVRTIASQPSWVICNGAVELAVTRLGGHMAPVTFFRDTKRPVQPYYISPWQGEKLDIPVAVLVPLRGDFFCAPFGNNDVPYRGESHAPHGETATARWTLAGATRTGDVTTLDLAMRTKVRVGKVTKRLSLVEGQNVVYCRHVMEGFTGRMPVGHHATLALPETEGAMRIATSPIRFGMTNPDWFSRPANREYQSLAVGKRFASITKVPTLWKDPAWADLSRYPARIGFEDLVGLASRKQSTPAWTAATNTEGGYLWFSLKDAAVLPMTTFWMSGGGRHAAPWSGRNRCLGLEEVCGYFADGLAASARANALTRAGVPTAISLSPRTPTAVNTIQGVARVPRGFGRVLRARFTPGEVTFFAAGGKKVAVPVRHEFIKAGRL